MTEFIIYQMKAAFCLAVFCVLYSLLFRKETYYSFNRIYLLSAIILSMLLPAIYLGNFNSTGNILPVAIKSVTVMAYKANGGSVQGSLKIHYLSLLYISIMTVSVMFLLHQLVRIRLLTRGNKSLFCDGYRIVMLEKGNHTFSFFNRIFVPAAYASDHQYKQVILHELAHIRQRHSIDILILKIIKILQWFNPFIYFMETMLKETHEYLADEAVLKQDSDANGYRLLLLSQVFGMKPGLFSFFNHSLFKNRLIMMTKRKSMPASRLKYLAIIPGLALMMAVVCCHKTESLAPPPPPPPPPATEAISPANKSDGQEAFIKVDEQAQFQGGDISKFRDWIQANMVYPPEAIKNKMYGKVVVKFAINSEGKLSDIEVLRSASPILSESAIQALTKSPDWIPAKVKGQAVKQQFVIPVEFALK